jgi:hypothetical protein
MMRNIFLNLAAAVAVFVPAAAFAGCVGASPIPSFTVGVKDPPVNYDFGRDSASLGRIASENGMPSLGRTRVPYGITIGRYDLEVSVETEAIRSGNGYCAQLRAAHVEIGLKQLDVVVDRRFAAGTCERQAILDHEGQHVEVFREALRYYMPAIQRSLANSKLPEAIYLQDRKASRDAYLQPVTEALQPVFEAINGRARDGNTRLDAPENYAEVFKRCTTW